MNVNDILVSHGLGSGQYRRLDKIPFYNFENGDFW